MGIREHLGPQVPVRDLPAWRKVVVLTGFALCLFLGWMAAWNEIKIYYSAPSQPVAATGQVYETHVMHSSVRYVSLQQQERLSFWEDEALPWGGHAVSYFIFYLCYDSKKADAAFSKSVIADTVTFKYDLFGRRTEKIAPRATSCAPQKLMRATQSCGLVVHMLSKSESA